MTSISKKGWLGLAREATPGTAIVAPTLYLPTKSTAKNVKKFVYTDEERGSRDGNNDRVETIRSAMLTSKGPWYNDSAVYLLLSFMGSDTPTQPNSGTAPTVWSHALALTDVPPSLTTTRSFDAVVYQFAYSAVEKLVYTWDADAKLFECESSIQAMYGSKLGSPPTPAFTSVKAFAGYMPSISLSGTPSTIISGMTITLEQKVSLWYGSNGLADFAKLDYGERTAKLEFDARFDDDTFYNKYFNSPAVDDAVIVSVTGQTIASTYKQSLSLNFPVVGYDEMDLDTSKNNIGIKAKATARPGTSVNSLFTATVQNSVASYTV